MDEHLCDGKTKYNLSFAGCGFLGVYHIGVACAVKEYAPHLLVGKVAGASAGSVAAVALVCDICLGEGTSNVLKIVNQARSRILGPLHPDFDIMSILRDGLMSSLPTNAHELCTGRLHVSLTRFSDGKNVIVSQFRSKEELIQAVICSSFIPFYCGTVPPLFQGVRYIDGGWSDNLLVLDKHTLTVSPFSGESDICPQDADSASFLDFTLMNTSIRFNAKNLYRFSFALFPPHPEILSELCRQGFQDMLRFLATRNMISCTRCISVKSSIRLPTEEDAAFRSRSPRHRSFPNLSAVMREQEPPQMEATVEGSLFTSCSPIVEHDEHEHEDDASCQSCGRLEDRWTLESLPLVVRETLAYSENLEKTALAYVLNSRPLKLLRYVSMPWVVPVDLTITASMRFLRWLPSLPRDALWFVSRATEALNFIIATIETHRHRYSARFSCQLAVTDYNLVNSAEMRVSRAPSRKASSASADTVHGSQQLKMKNLNLGFSFELGGSGMFRQLNEPGPTRSAYGHLADLTSSDPNLEPSSHYVSTGAVTRAAREVEMSLLEQEHSRMSRFPASPVGSFVGGGRSQSVPRLCVDLDDSQAANNQGQGLEGGGPPATTIDSTESGLTMQDLDAFESVLEFTKQHEAVLSWYYLDDNNRVRVNEIFGLSEQEQTALEAAVATAQSRGGSRVPSRQMSRRPSLTSLKSSHGATGGD